MGSVTKSLGVLLIVWAVVTKNVADTKAEQFGKSSPQKRSAGAGLIQLCGHRLYEAVRAMCGGSGMVVSKKSEPYSLAPLLEELALSQDGRTGYPSGEEPSSSDDLSYYLTESTNNPYYPYLNWGPQQQQQQQQGKTFPRFRRARNIIDECCHNSCSATHLLNYCRRV